MKNLLKAEFYYLFKNKRFYVFLGIIVLVNIIATIFKQSILAALCNFLAFIFAAIIILEFSHKDFNQKTMKNYVGSGLNLFKVYIGKMIVCITAVFMILVVLTITNTIAGLSCGNIVTDQSQITELSSSISQNSNKTSSEVDQNSASSSQNNQPELLNIGGLIASVFVNILKCVVVFAICSLIPSGAGSIIVSLFYIIGIPLIIEFVNQPIIQSLRPFLLDSIQQALKSSGTIVAGLETFPAIAWHFAVTFVVVIVLAFIGALVYSKREVK